MDNNKIAKNCHYLEAQKFVDGFDGWLGILEKGKNIPFEIKRVYYINNLFAHENVARGKHAHKKLEQALFCVNGSCDIVIDDGENRREIVLANDHQGIYLGSKVWHEMKNFRNNCILLVLASDFFDEADYIRDYQKFIEYVNGNNV
jgi:dTDP-4-dehydrorhamnose 3,5-epimerase-like enzyme